MITLVPCRTASARLPAKALRPLHGLRAIERCLLNTLAIEASTHSVLATTTSSGDDELASCTLDGTVDVVRGPEADVLERFLLAMDRYDPDVVIRATGDCPAVSYELADLLVEAHLDSGADVTFLGSGFAPGTNSEVYRAGALRRLRELSPETPYSEYLPFYFTSNPDAFVLNEVGVPDRFVRDWRLTLDDANDLALFEWIYSALNIGGRAIAFEEIVSFFEQHPEAARLNAGGELRYLDDHEFAEHLRHATSLSGGVG